MSPNLIHKINYQDALIQSLVILPPISKRFAWILYIEACDTIIYKIAERFQNPDLLVQKNILDVFVNLSD